MPKKKTVAKKAAPKKQMSKADFVRSLPASTSAKDAVVKAKAAGVALTESYFYNVRATDKSTKKKSAKTSTPKKTTAPKSNGTTSAMGSETTFRKLVLDLGIAKSKTLLAEVERGIAAVIAGR
jgi:hypothetical protein